MDQNFKADKGMAGRGGQVRKHEESGETPIKQKKPMSSKSPAFLSATSGAAMAELRSMLIEGKNGQNKLQKFRQKANDPHKHCGQSARRYIYGVKQTER